MKKKVQIGRSRMLEELARPTWEAASKPVREHKKKDTKQPQKVETISSAPVAKRKLKAAAYARVSTDLDSQETSIENQCDHYLHLIESNPASAARRRIPDRSFRSCFMTAKPEPWM